MMSEKTYHKKIVDCETCGALISDQDRYQVTADDRVLREGRAAKYKDILDQLMIKEQAKYCARLDHQKGERCDPTRHGAKHDSPWSENYRAEFARLKQKTQPDE